MSKHLWNWIYCNLPKGMLHFWGREHQWIACVIRFQKLYGLYCLKHHNVEKGCWLTFNVWHTPKTSTWSQNSLPIYLFTYSLTFTPQLQKMFKLKLIWNSLISHLFCEWIHSMKAGWTSTIKCYWDTWLPRYICHDRDMIIESRSQH